MAVIVGSVNRLLRPSAKPPHDSICTPWARMTSWSAWRWKNGWVSIWLTAGDAAVADRASDGLLVPVRGGGVDVAVPDLEGRGHGLRGVLRWDLEDAEAEDRHLDTVVQRDVRDGGGHAQVAASGRRVAPPVATTMGSAILARCAVGGWPLRRHVASNDSVCAKGFHRKPLRFIRSLVVAAPPPSDVFPVASPGAVAVLATVDHRVSMPEPRIEIVYCTQCRWLPRAAWLAQELLTTFEPDLGEVALVPGAGGVFVVRVDGELVWDRRDQGFPEPVAVKNAVRDRIAPGRDLGHADRPPP
jgi:selenoprotein W-related protein